MSLYVGGEGSWFRNDILRFNPETQSWDDTGKKLGIPTAHHAATSIDNCPSKCLQTSELGGGWGSIIC